MHIVGPVRLRTIHTTKKERCRLETDLENCYYQEMDFSNLNTTMIDGVPFKTCEELNSVNSVNGEQGVFPCGGYVLDMYPN